MRNGLKVLWGCVVGPLGLAALVGAAPGPAEVGPGAPGPPTLTAARFIVVDLGTFGGEESSATHINNRGQVIGEADIPAPAPGARRSHPFLWQNGVMTDLSSSGLGVVNSLGVRAVALNDLGQILGDEGHGPLLWQDGVWRRLPPVNGVSLESAWLFNAQGQILGSFRGRPVLRRRGRMTGLGAVPGGRPPSARRLNEKGQVVGDVPVESGIPADPAITINRAFISEGGQMRLLASPDKVEGYMGSEASAINNSGQIAGWFYRGEEGHACLWEEGQREDLGTLRPLSGSYAESYARDINDRAQVVGSSAGYLSSAAFLWEHGTMLDLNRLIPADTGWALERAEGINNRGEIVGSGRFQGHGRAFLLRPVRLVQAAPDKRKEKTK